MRHCLTCEALESVMVPSQVREVTALEVVGVREVAGGLDFLTVESRLFLTRGFSVTSATRPCATSSWSDSRAAGARRGWVHSATCSRRLDCDSHRSRKLLEPAR